jgi:hypothetical protein
MRFPHHGLQVDLDDDWWKEAGMAGFSPISRAYRTDPRFSELASQFWKSPSPT